MQQQTKYLVAVAALTLLVLAARLIISFQVAEPGYESYFSLLQAEEIRETGTPLFEDPHSYGGRRYAFDPAYYYLIALASLVLPATLAVKLLPNLCMALLVPLVYLLGLSLTRNRGHSLMAAAFAGFSPALFLLGINQAVPLTLALPVLAGALLAFIDARPRLCLALTFLLTLLSPLVWLLLLAELVHLIILSAERLKPGVSQLELSLTTFLIAAWYTLVAYKEALFSHGLAVLQESLPATVRAATFEEFTFLAMLYAVGVVPLALGSLALYHTTFGQRSRKVLLFAALGMVTLLAALARLLPLSLVLVLLSLVFVILAAAGLQAVRGYLRRTRFERAAPAIIAAFLLFFLLTSLLPSLVGVYPGSSPTPDELEAMAWAAGLPEGSVLLAAPKTGFLINHAAGKPYVADEAYLLAPNPDRRLADIDAAYAAKSSIPAVDIIERYGVTHILVGPAENERYGDIGAFLSDERCFPRVFQNPRALIMAKNCTIIGGAP